MKLLARLALAATLATCVAAQAQTPAGPAVAGAQAVKATATVESVDATTRMVTLKGEKGELLTFKAGPEVKNLAQVKKGDVVTFEYARALALELKKGGDGIASRVETPASGAAKPGQKPAGVVADTVVITAPVTAVDTAAKTVTVTGPNNRPVTMAVKDPAILAQVKVGDTVQATYTEALMISVSAPQKK